MTNHLDTLRTQFDVPRLKGEEAARAISVSPHEPYDIVGFDAADGARLGFQPGDLVSIAPDDTGRSLPSCSLHLSDCPILQRENFRLLGN